MFGFLSSSSWIGFGLALSMPCVLSKDGSAPEDISTNNAGKIRPNIVVFLGDNLGHGDVGAFGSPSVPGRTPNLDSLALEGMKLSAFNSVSHLCSPSRAALLTGRYPVRSGVFPGVFKPDSVRGMDRSETTLADRLREEGYATAVVGKWHLGHAPSYLPTDRGFDEWTGIPYHPSGGSTDGHVCGFDANATTWLPLYDGADIIQQPVDLAHLADAYAAAADRFVARATEEGRPFFLYVPFSHVHQLCAPKRDACQWADPARSGAAALHAASFGDAVEEMDWIAGRILGSLDRHGVGDALVLFTSDNGPWLAEQGCAGSRGGFEGRWLRENVDAACTACPKDYVHAPEEGRLRRCVHDARKMAPLDHRIYVVDGVHCGEDVGLGSYWEANVRLPAMVRWRGIVEAGSESMEPVATIDIVPTLLAILGATSRRDDQYLDGTDISHVLFKSPPAQNTTLLDERPLFFWREGFHDGPLPQPYGRYDVVAAKLGRIKAWFYTKSSHFNADPHVPHDPPLLFDWLADPAEAYPLDPDDHADIIEKIKGMVANHIASVGLTDPLTLERDAAYIPCFDKDTKCRTYSPPSSAPSVESDQKDGARAFRPRTEAVVAAD